MHDLEQAILKAIEAGGSTSEANKAYLEFIKANFVIPVEKSEDLSSEPKVLFLQEKDQIFLPVFTRQAYFDAWAQEIASDIAILTLTGVDLLKGVGENVTVCLNIGTDRYKEFNPSEIARMRSIVLKLFK